MSIANDNHILFYFKNWYNISFNKIGILLYFIQLKTIFALKAIWYILNKE